MKNEKRHLVGESIDILQIFKLFLNNTISDQIIVKICHILSELKQNWKSLWFNKNTIEMEFEESSFEIFNIPFILF